MLAAAVGLNVLFAGCVRRTLMIRTEPEGARVFLNDKEVGTSPVDVDFTWYGDYDVIVRKDGYETLQTSHNVEPPWYQRPPVDFIADVLVPFTIHDQREANFTLRPAPEVDTAELLQDAQRLREQALYGQDQ
jgi:hypothetical protein